MAAERARDAAVAGVLGAALLGAAAAAAPVSGSAMGAAVAGALFSLAACRFSATGGCGRLAASTAALLAGIALLQVAGLAEGLARSVFGSSPLLPGPVAAVLAAAALAAGVAARDAPSVLPPWGRHALSLAVFVLAAVGAVWPPLLAAAGLGVGAYMLGEMLGWARGAAGA